jgi:putative transposase
LPSADSTSAKRAVIHRAFKFRLYASPEAEQAFVRWSGVVRAVYNVALRQREEHWRNFKAIEGRSISFPSQCRELTMLRAEFDWVRECPQNIQAQALRDLDAAYANFFKGTAGYPTPRKKSLNDSFRFEAKECGEVVKLNAKWATVRLPKIGPVKFRLTRMPQGKIKNVTVTREANGWHIVFTCEIEHTAPMNIKPAVGVDRGVANHVALSTGELMSLDKQAADKLDRQARRAQRAMSRRKRGSKRYAKARARAAKLMAKAARVRKHWQHEVSTGIVQRFGTVVMEKLQVRNMTKSAKGTKEKPGKKVAQKRGLNRSILGAAWYQFQTFVRYKIEAAGGSLHFVNPAYTSQTCSSCGVIDSRSRKSQAAFECVDCGHKQHADINAARNIERRWNTPLQLVEGAGVKPKSPVKREPRAAKAA